MEGGESGFSPLQFPLFVGGRRQDGFRMVSGWRWCGGWGSDSWGFSSPRSRLGWSGRPDPGGSLPGVALHVWGSGCLFLASFLLH